MDEDLPISEEDKQESGAGGQQGRSKSEHSLERGRRGSASVAPDDATADAIRSEKERTRPAQDRGGQPIHNRDPRAPHTANRGAGSEDDEGRDELAS